MSSHATATAAAAALRAALEGRQVPLLRGCMKIARDIEDVGPLGGGEQPFVHLAIGDLSGSRRFASGLHAGVARGPAGPGVRGQR